MAVFQNTIDLLGDEVVAASIIDRTITEFHDDVLTALGVRAMQECGALVSVKLPNLESLGERALQKTAIVSAAFPKLKSLGATAFGWNSSLAFADIGEVNKIGQGAFASCTALKTIVLRSNGVVVLENISYFQNTPFYTGKTGGTAYVPQALITEYQNATNWSTLYAAGTCNFVAIEGSEYE